VTSETEPTPVAAGSLRKVAVRGGAVTVAGQGGKTLLQFISIPILARLLSPEDFGIIATVGIFLALGDIVRDFGLTSAALQAKSLSHPQKSTLFWTSVAIGTALALIMVPVSFALPSVFGRPELYLVGLATAINFPISGAQAQYQVELARNGRFASLAFSSLAAQAIGISIAVAIAFAGFGYWALVVQILATGGSQLVIRVSMTRWFPSPPWKLVSIRSFLGYGANLGAAQLVGYAATNADTATMSFRFGAESVGAYSRAYSLLIVPTFQLMSPLTNMAVPMLAKCSGDMKSQFTPMLKSAQIMVSVPLIMLFAVSSGLAKHLINLLLGPQWSQSAELFAILGLGGFFQALSYVVFWGFLSLAKTRQLLHCNLATKGSTVLAIVIGSHWGPTGIAWAVTISLAASWPISLCWLGRGTEIPRASLLTSALPAILAGLATFGLLTFGFRADHYSLPIVLGLGAMGCGFYIGLLTASPRGRRDLGFIIQSLMALRRGRV